MAIFIYNFDRTKTGTTITADMSFTQDANLKLEGSVSDSVGAVLCKKGAYGEDIPIVVNNFYVNVNSIINNVYSYIIGDYYLKVNNPFGETFKIIVDTEFKDNDEAAAMVNLLSGMSGGTNTPVKAVINVPLLVDELYDNSSSSIITVNMNLVVGKNYVLTVEGYPGTYNITRNGANADIVFNSNVSPSIPATAVIVKAVEI